MEEISVTRALIAELYENPEKIKRVYTDLIRQSLRAIEGLKEYATDPDNYGPAWPGWGGDGTRSDFIDINKADYNAQKGVGGDKLRAMIKAKMRLGGPTMGRGLYLMGEEGKEFVRTFVDGVETGEGGCDWLTCSDWYTNHDNPLPCSDYHPESELDEDKHSERIPHIGTDIHMENSCCTCPRHQSPDERRAYPNPLGSRYVRYTWLAFCSCRADAAEWQ